MDVQQHQIEELQTTVDDRDREIAQLKTEIARLSNPTTGKQLHKNTLPSRSLTTESSSHTPSYARPTVASTNRAANKAEPAQVQNSETIDDRSPVYADGKPVVVEGKPRPVWDDRASSSEGEQTLWKSDARSASPPKTFRMHYGTCQTCNKLEEAWKDKDAHSLAARSRLDDAGVNFQDSAAACVNILYRKQYQLLNSAKCIAQDIIWHHLRKHCPSRQIDFCFEGPREFRLGRSELKCLIEGVQWNLKDHRMTYILEVAMLEISDLRNTLAHQNHESLAMVDNLITRVQKLAVICLEENSAMAIRRLRDELRSHAEKAVAAIGERVDIQGGPNPDSRQWALHHQRTFKDLVDAYQYKEHWRYDSAPEIVKHAAWEWKEANHGSALGKRDPEYIAALEEATAPLAETHRTMSLVDEGTNSDWLEKEAEGRIRKSKSL